MKLDKCGRCKYCEINGCVFGYCNKNDIFVDYQDANKPCYEEYKDLEHLKDFGDVSRAKNESEYSLDEINKILDVNLKL